MQTGGSIPTFRYHLSVPFLRAKQFNFEMRPIGCPEISNYQSKMRKTPEERIFHENVFTDFRVVS
jgi:hypothetical protein